MVLGNALVPHSIDHMMSLLIHLQAAIAAYTLRWDSSIDRALFPLATDVGLLEYVTLPLLILCGWAILHTAFMLAVGISLPAKGHKTVFGDHVRSESAVWKLVRGGSAAVVRDADGTLCWSRQRERIG